MNAKNRNKSCEFLCRFLCSSFPITAQNSQHEVVLSPNAFFISNQNPNSSKNYSCGPSSKTFLIQKLFLRMKSVFKERKPFAERAEDSAKIREQHPDKVPIIVERSKSGKICQTPFFCLIKPLKICPE